MVVITGQYLGEKHCKMVHGPSNSILKTDAPLDNNGKGENFSPTDLVAAALGSCLMTIMGIYADKNNINITGSTYKVVKKMQQAPRKIAELEVEIVLPEHLSAEERVNLEAVAMECPVKKSLHPDVQLPITFFYKSF
jgi:putative redox protein